MQIKTLDIDGYQVRVATRRGRGDGPPLLLFNGIGANVELLEPLMSALDGVETIAFDVPGTGGSAPRSRPYRLSKLAKLAVRVLAELGHEGQVDVLGVSWGGALAQQFAFRYPQRCRRLILAATTPGALMVPGALTVLGKLVNPRRYKDADHLARIGPDIYGGEMRRDPELLREYMDRLQPPHWRGYLHQQLALLTWTSLPWLPLLRQPTLILAGKDDPLVPLANARILAWLIPDARLEVIDDGHLFLLSRPQRVAPLIRDFLAAPAGTRLSPRLEAVD